MAWLANFQENVSFIIWALPNSGFAQNRVAQM